MSVILISLDAGAKFRRLTAFWMLNTQLPQKYPLIFISTLFAWARFGWALKSRTAKTPSTTTASLFIRIFLRDDKITGGKEDYVSCIS